MWWLMLNCVILSSNIYMGICAGNCVCSGLVILIYEPPPPVLCLLLLSGLQAGRLYSKCFCWGFLWAAAYPEPHAWIAEACVFPQPSVILKSRSLLCSIFIWSHHCCSGEGIMFWCWCQGAMPVWMFVFRGQSWSVCLLCLCVFYAKVSSCTVPHCAVVWIRVCRLASLCECVHLWLWIWWVSAGRLFSSSPSVWLRCRLTCFPLISAQAQWGTWGGLMQVWEGWGRFHHPSEYIHWFGTHIFVCLLSLYLSVPVHFPDSLACFFMLSCLTPKSLPHPIQLLQLQLLLFLLLFGNHLGFIINRPLAMLSSEMAKQ